MPPPAGETTLRSGPHSNERKAELTKATVSGFGALLAAPLVVIAGVLVQPTLSDRAADQAAALANHRSAVIAGLTLQTISVTLLIAGTVWLALALSRHAGGLALAGGVLGVLGSLVVLFENGVAAAAPSVVRGLGSGQATAALDRIHSSAAVSALEPISLLGDIGLALLGLAVVRAGGSRVSGAAIAIGALAEGAGFASGTKAVVVVAFAVLFLGLADAVRTLVGRPAHGVQATVAVEYQA